MRRNAINTPHNAACQRTRVAESGVATVDACSCGTLHLNLGPLTLRLTPEAFRELVGTLGYALACLREHDAGRHPTLERNVC